MTGKKPKAGFGKKLLKKTSNSRPPIVVIVGHVDHGKTTLLDKIRTSNQISKELGGITQHIGAYQTAYKNKLITFLDTPGHEAFIKMRSRGVEVADLAVLVVAADDGVKPQTKEAIKHIQTAKLPMIVAINKIDLAQASADMVKAQLAENNVLVEGYGGDVVCIETSAKNGQGIDSLLEMILLVGEMQEITADAKKPLEAVVLEAFMDKSKGLTANVLVINGTMRSGQEVMAEKEGSSHVFIKAKIKIIFNNFGKEVLTVLPGQPAQILGFKKMPAVGSKIELFDKEKYLQSQKTSLLPLQATNSPLTELQKTLPQDYLSLKPSKKDKINLILKADVQGTLEAIKVNLTDEVNVLYSGVGNISESDVLLALSTGAELIGFNVEIPASVIKLAAMEKVKIKTYQVIYKLLEYLEKRILKMIEPTINEEVIGEAKIIAEFKIKGNHIAGCKVTSGTIDKIEKIKILRENKLIGQTKIVSLQKNKLEGKQAKKGEEVGLVFKPDMAFLIGDVIISYRILDK